MAVILSASGWASVIDARAPSAMPAHRVTGTARAGPAARAAAEMAMNRRRDKCGIGGS